MCRQSQGFIPLESMKASLEPGYVVGRHGLELFGHPEAACSDFVHATSCACLASTGTSQCIRVVFEFDDDAFLFTELVVLESRAMKGRVGKDSEALVGDGEVLKPPILRDTPMGPFPQRK